MARRNRLVWVRAPRNANTVSGLPVDTANVQSVRAESAYAIGAGVAHSVDGAFTLKRLLMWWQFVHRTAQITTVTPYGAVSARVGNSREFVEFGTDAAFLATNGGLADLDADWLMWNPTMASAVSQAAAGDAYVGRGFVDIRAQRRCDEPGEDIFIFSQVQNIAAGDVTTLAMSWAALCEVEG